MNAAKIRHQIDQYLEQLSPERLRVTADLLAYLAEHESEEASEELLKIPGFVEAFEKAKQDIAAGGSLLNGEKYGGMYNVRLIADIN